MIAWVLIFILNNIYTVNGNSANACISCQWMIIDMLAKHIFDILELYKVLS